MRRTSIQILSATLLLALTRRELSGGLGRKRSHYVEISALVSPASTLLAAGAAGYRALSPGLDSAASLPNCGNCRGRSA